MLPPTGGRHWLGNAASDKTQGFISYYAGETSIYQATGRGIRGNSAGQRRESSAKLAQPAKSFQAFSRLTAGGMAEKLAAEWVAGHLPEAGYWPLHRALRPLGGSSPVALSLPYPPGGSHWITAFTTFGHGSKAICFRRACTAKEPHDLRSFRFPWCESGIAREGKKRRQVPICLTFLPHKGRISFARLRSI